MSPFEGRSGGTDCPRRPVSGGSERVSTHPNILVFQCSSTIVFGHDSSAALGGLPALDQ